MQGQPCRGGLGRSSHSRHAGAAGQEVGPRTDAGQWEGGRSPRIVMQGQGVVPRTAVMQGKGDYAHNM